MSEEDVYTVVYRIQGAEATQDRGFYKGINGGGSAYYKDVE